MWIFDGSRFAVATTSTATNATSPEILFRYTDNSNRWIPLETAGLHHQGGQHGVQADSLTSSCTIVGNYVGGWHERCCYRCTCYLYQQQQEHHHHHRHRRGCYFKYCNTIHHCRRRPPRYGRKLVLMLLSIDWTCVTTMMTETVVVTFIISLFRWWKTCNSDNY